MSPETLWPYSALGLTNTPDTTAEIRRAYAAKLKTIDQATDIPGFTALRHAYEAALALTERRKAPAPALPAIAETPTQPDTIPRTAPPPSPDLAERRRLTTLLTSYGDGRPLADRLTEILAHPLSSDADHGPALRDAIANAITLVSQPGSDDRNLPVSLDGTVLRALDARYGWLSDYTTFARDFPPDADLLDMMAIRAYPQMTRQGNVAPSDPGNRLLKVLSNPSVLIFGILVSAHLASNLTGSSSRPDQPSLFVPGAQSQALAFALLGFGSLFIGYMITHSAPIRHIRKFVAGWLALTIALLILRSQGPTIPPMTLPVALWLTLPLWAATLIWIKRTLFTP